MGQNPNRFDELHLQFHVSVASVWTQWDQLLRVRWDQYNTELLARGMEDRKRRTNSPPTPGQSASGHLNQHQWVGGTNILISAISSFLWGDESCLFFYYLCSHFILKQMAASLFSSNTQYESEYFQPQSGPPLESILTRLSTSRWQLLLKLQYLKSHL